MELKEFLDKYPKWLQRNGIGSLPDIKKAEWTGVEGIEPPTLMTWTNSVGFRHVQGAEVILQQLQAMPRHGLVALRAHYELDPLPGDVPTLSWEDFINPPPPTADAPKIHVGAAIPEATVIAFEPSGLVNRKYKYFAQGGLDIPVNEIYTDPRDGVKYISVNPGSMFMTWLRQL